MATVYQNRSPAGPAKPYTTRQEPDTRVPPKARPVLTAISVNGVAVPEAEILAEAQHHPAASPGEAVAAAARALVVRELLLQEARRAGVASAPERDAAGRVETDEDAVVRALLERELAVPTAGEDECLRFYRADPGRFSAGTIWEARHILLAAASDDASARRAARTQATRLEGLLRKDASGFAEFARIHSDCPSASQGGNLGQITRGSTVPEFERALARLEPGRAAIVESRYGFHVVVVERRIDADALPFEMVRERIAAWLEAASWSRAVAQYIAVLAGRADIRGIDLDAAEGPLVQ